MPSSAPRRNRNRLGAGLTVASSSVKSSRGGVAKVTTASVVVTPRFLPARISQGTPAQRHESISNRTATKVSVSECGSTPSASLYDRYWPRTACSGSKARTWRNSLTRSSRNDAASDPAGGSMAMRATICSRWFCTTSRQRADALVERAAAAHAELLGHGDLHARDEVAVPHRLEQRVGEAEHQQVLDGLLAEEVVDAEHRRLGEDLVDHLVEVVGRRGVAAERLLDHHPRTLGQAHAAEALDHVGEHRRRDGQVEERARAGRRAPRPAGRRWWGRGSRR